jgi:SPOR domain
MKIMRGVFLALLLANLLYLISALWLVEPKPADEALPQGFARIALAREVPRKPRRCITIGPFDEAAEIAAASNLLREVGYLPRSRIENGEFADGYLVFLKDIRSTGQLDRAMARLRRAGIRDAAIVPDGSPGIRVSVGAYRDLSRAQARADSVRKLGLAADVLERLSPGAKTWLDLDLRSAGEELDPTTLKADGSLQVKPCPSAS